jgi:hypothetical protein
MDDLASCAPEGEPFATQKNCAGHQPHELPGRHMILRQKREERQNNQREPARPSSPRRKFTCNVITTSMSGDPAIASIEELVHAWQLREGSKRPGPPDLAGEKHHGLRPTDIAAVGSQNAHLFERRSRLEIEPLHDPGCLQRQEKETTAAKYSIESSDGSGAGVAGAIV